MSALQPLFAHYEEEIVRFQRLLDPDNRILYAIEHLTNTVSEIAAVIVDGFYDFTPLQYQFIQALKQAGIPIEVYLPADRNFAVIDDTFRDLRDIGFTSRYEPYNSEPTVKEYTIAAATTEHEQWQGLLRDIALSYYRYEEIAVVFANEGKEKEAFIHVAEQAGVPLNSAKKTKAAKHSDLPLFVRDFKGEPFYRNKVGTSSIYRTASRCLLSFRSSVHEVKAELYSNRQIKR